MIPADDALPPHLRPYPGDRIRSDLRVQVPGVRDYRHLRRAIAAIDPTAVPGFDASWSATIDDPYDPGERVVWRRLNVLNWIEYIGMYGEPVRRADLADAVTRAHDNPDALDTLRDTVFAMLRAVQHDNFPLACGTDFSTVIQENQEGGYTAMCPITHVSAAADSPTSARDALRLRIAAHLEC